MLRLQSTRTTTKHYSAREDRGLATVIRGHIGLGGINEDSRRFNLLPSGLF